MSVRKLKVEIIQEKQEINSLTDLTLSILDDYIQVKAGTMPVRTGFVLSKQAEVAIRSFTCSRLIGDEITPMEIEIVKPKAS